MNDIMKVDVNNELTMSSREIAELTGKTHGNVMRDIRTMMGALQQNSDLNPVCKSITYTGENGQSYSQYELDKDTCLTLLLGYDAVARMKVVKRWQELENGLNTFQLPDFTNPAEAAIAWAEQWKKRELAEQSVLRLEQKIDEDAPKVLLADALLESNGGIRIGDFAKTSYDTYGLGRNKMYKKFKRVEAS